MPTFLLITLAAPMASFGLEAGHKRRSSRERPTRSALLGLLSAALGIHRDDDENQRKLAETVATAVRVDNPGWPLQDFHTAQYVPTARLKKPNSRRAALARLKPADNPELTCRDYRMDVHYTAAYARHMETCPWSLEDMAKALRCPRFTLYLGRKSCPLSLPLYPRIIKATDILAALERNAAPDGEKKQAMLRNTVSQASTSPYIAVDHRAEIHTATHPPRLDRVNDQPLDRRRWHFAPRHEALYPLSANREDKS